MEQSTKKRILFLTHFYPPEMGGASARISGLAKWLVKFGHDVSVITGYPNYPMGKIYPEYRNKKKKIEFIDGVRVFRVRVLPASFQSIIIRLLNYFTLFITAFWIGIKKRKDFDIIIASSPPLTIGLLGLILSKIYQVPWILDIRDILPDVAVEAGMLKEDSYVHRITRWLANYLYKKSSHITPVTERKLDKIIATGISKYKISVVSNGVDFDIIESSVKNDWRKNLGIEKKFVLIYAGLIGIAQGVKIIIDSANQLKNNQDIHFVIVGDGVEKNKIQKRIKKLELQNVTILDSQPKEYIPSLLKASDVSIIPLINDKLLDAVPSKLLEAWACKLPVILVAAGEAADIVKDAKGGIVANSDDIGDVTKSIIRLKKSPNLMQEYASNGHKYVASNFDRKKLAKDMENIININLGE